MQEYWGGNLDRYTCAIYNSENGSIFDNYFVIVTKSVQTKIGDVVVDRSADLFKFYMNGEQVGVGVEKPSTMEGDLFVFVSIFSDL
jgi:hypothetical protein